MTGPGVQRLSERAGTLLTRLRLAERRDRRYTRRFRGWLIGTALALAGGVGGAMAAGRAIWLVAVPVVLAGGYQAWRYRRLDFDDRKLAVALRLVTVLRADVRQDERIEMTVDFRGYDHGGQLVERTGSYRGTIVRKYRHAWLSVRVRLADGNVIALTILDRVQRRQEYKRSFWKTKVKPRVRARTEIELAVRLAKRYRPAGDLVARLRARSRPVPLPLVRLDASTDGVHAYARFRSPVTVDLRAPVTVDLAALPGADAALGALRWLYAGLAAGARRTG